MSGWPARAPRIRDDVVLATKIGARTAPGSSDLTNTLGLSAGSVRQQTIECLRLLRTAHVDVLYAHIDDRRVPFEETLGALADLKREGLTREIAASNLTGERLAEAVRAGEQLRAGYVALQQWFTYLVPDPSADLSPHVLLDATIEQRCTDAGITMFGYSPLLSGAYTRQDRPMPTGYDTPAQQQPLGALHSVSTEVGLDPGQTVLARMARRSQPVIPVVGVSKLEQLSSAITAATSRLSAESLAALDTARASQ